MSLRQQLASLCDNTVLVSVLAGIGFLLVCCGGNGYWQQSQPKTGPVSLTVGEVEAAEAIAKLPKAHSLELRGGYLFWAGAKERIRFQKILGKKVKNSENVEAIYVPLLSQITFARWQAHLAKGGPARTLPYHECRAIVVFSPWEMDEQLPADAAAPRSFYASVRRLADEDKDFVKDMTKGAFGYDENWTLVLYPQSYRDNAKVNRILSACIGVFGLLTLMPLGVWAFRRWRRPKMKQLSFQLPIAETISLENEKEKSG